MCVAKISRGKSVHKEKQEKHKRPKHASGWICGAFSAEMALPSRRRMFVHASSASSGKMAAWWSRGDDRAGDAPLPEARLWYACACMLSEELWRPGPCMLSEELWRPGVCTLSGEPWRACAWALSEEPWRACARPQSEDSVRTRLQKTSEAEMTSSASTSESERVISMASGKDARRDATETSDAGSGDRVDLAEACGDERSPRCACGASGEKSRGRDAESGGDATTDSPPPPDDRRGEMRSRERDETEPGADAEKGVGTEPRLVAGEAR